MKTPPSPLLTTSYKRSYSTFSGELSTMELASCSRIGLRRSATFASTSGSALPLTILPDPVLAFLKCLPTINCSPKLPPLSGTLGKWKGTVSGKKLLRITRLNMAMSTHTKDRYLWRSGHLRKSQGLTDDVYRKNYSVSYEHNSVFWASNKRGVASWQPPHYLFLCLVFYCRAWSVTLHPVIMKLSIFSEGIMMGMNFNRLYWYYPLTLVL